MTSLPRSLGIVAVGALALGLTACSTDDAKDDQHGHAGFVQTNLVANWDAYDPQIVEPGLQNAWGISLRPAGAGGHFWVTANATGTSFEYLGDVDGQELTTDDLKVVDIPGLPGEEAGTPTGTVFNDGGDGFEITQEIDGEDYTAPAKFLFATDTGLVTAWTEKELEGGDFARPTASEVVHNSSKKGSSFLGMGISPEMDRIYLADFGAKPGLVVLDDAFQPVKDAGFASPFEATYQPFNVQTLGDSVFVTYAAWDSAGEEAPAPGEGKVAEFSSDGELIAEWDGGRYLNAPWGVAIAPEGFGAHAGDLLVGNFGDGTIAVIDSETHEAVDFLRRPDGHRVEIDGLWGITFGNGESLGEEDALYFAAGPGPEADGVFGRLTYED